MSNFSTNLRKPIYIYILSVFKDNIYSQSRKSKYKIATLFMVFAFFFYFIDFNKVVAADCDGCTNGSWVASNNLEKISVNYAGCNAEFTYEKKVCSTPPPTKYELRITGFELSPGCSTPDIENLMKEANKKLLWSARSIFGVTGTSIDVTLYTKSCWYLNTTPTPDKLEPCSNIDDCCVTDYELETDGEGGGLEITNSTQTNASDSTCVGSVGGACGEYICDTQNLPTNVPLWDVDNTICGSECDNPWNADASDFVEVTSGSCTYRAYYAKRVCDGYTYFTIYQLSYSSGCSPNPTLPGTILNLINTQLFTRFSTYLTLPDTAYVTSPQCWSKTNNIFYTCNLDDCCTRKYFFDNNLTPKKASSIGTIEYTPQVIMCDQNLDCNLYVCTSLLASSVIFNKLTINDSDLNFSAYAQINPVPISDEFNMVINSDNKEIVKFIITDINGIELMKIDLNILEGNNNFNINSKNLKLNNVYFYIIINSNNEVIYNGKLIK